MIRRITFWKIWMKKKRIGIFIESILGITMAPRTMKKWVKNKEKQEVAKKTSI